MLTKFAKWLLFITSYVPLYLLLLLNNLGLEKWSEWIKPDILKQAFCKNLCFNWAIIFLSLCCVVILVCFGRLKSNSHIIYESEIVRNNSGDILNYFITYLFPLLSMDIKNANSIIVNGFVFLLIGLLYVKGDMLYLNPMLIFFRYHVIQIGDKILITKKNVVELQQYIAQEKKMGVRKICDEIYIEGRIGNRKKTSYVKKAE